MPIALPNHSISDIGSNHCSPRSRNRQQHQGHCTVRQLATLVTSHCIKCVHSTSNVNGFTQSLTTNTSLHQLPSIGTAMSIASYGHLSSPDQVVLCMMAVILITVTLLQIREGQYLLKAGSQQRLWHGPLYLN